MNNKPTPPFYVERRLFRIDEKGETQFITDAQLFNRPRPLVVLGEPGMGKTKLLERISSNFENACFVRAPAFVRRPEIWKQSSSGTVLVIDGLDEVAALQEGDPLHNVLRSLNAIGSPDFVLSCRAADWRNATASVDIVDDYRRAPEIWTLVEISRSDALTFLAGVVNSDETAKHIISSLDELGLKEFYGNPLTLELIVQVARFNQGYSPSSRGELFRLACDALLTDPKRSPSAINLLSKDQALDAAGAAFAAMLVTGADAIALENGASLDQHFLPGPEIAQLELASEILTVLSSRLFRANPDGSKSVLPYHRTVAEYLGARWLGRVLESRTRSASRFFSLITVEGTVPASLRGMFAWLSEFNQFTDRIIDADPYGVLRYGDPSSFSREQLRKLLEALKRLEQDDPC